MNAQGKDMHGMRMHVLIEPTVPGAHTIQYNSSCFVLIMVNSWYLIIHKSMFDDLDDGYASC